MRWINCARLTLSVRLCRAVLFWMTQHKFDALLCLAFVISFLVWNHFYHEEDIFIDNSIGSMLDVESVNAQSGQSCIHPVLPVWTPQLESLYADNKKQKLDCLNLGEEWIRTFDGKVEVANPGVTCNYTPIFRVNESAVVRGSPVQLDRPLQLVSEVFEVNCLNQAGGTRYTNLFPAITVDRKLMERSEEFSRRLPSSPSSSSSSSSSPSSSSSSSSSPLRLNVLMFAFDSVSRLAWMRSLPKSHAYFVDELGGFVMEGFNIVGDATTPNVLAMMTGNYVDELPESRRGFRNARTVDEFPWIWKHLRDVGYVTQYGEDWVDVSSFNHRLMGFQNQPVDYYLRNYLLAVKSDPRAVPYDQNYENFCIHGSTPSHFLLIKWMKDFFEVYRNQTKFSFVFSNGLSHSNAFTLSLVDDDLLEFLKFLNTRGHLSNTLLILMSDHGARFSQLRQTERGRLEERNPYFGLRLPPDLLSRFPDLLNNLKVNRYRLTTPFDVYETLRSIVSFTGTGKGEISRRGISLFKEIPKERRCVDAGIVSYYCSCLKWTKVRTDGDLVQRAAREAVAFINNMTIAERHLCAELSLREVTSAVRFRQNDALLRFRKNRDFHALWPDLSDRRKSSKTIYLLQIVTSPNQGRYEFSVDCPSHMTSCELDSKAISRIDRYGQQSKCVLDRLPHLKMFCYCPDI